MSRLTHSAGGFLRVLQMSSAQFFAFVEGGLDRPFYDRLIAKAHEGRTVRHQVIAAREMPGATGGKPALLNIFKKFRKAKYLNATAFGKRIVCAFFADKDCDDICRCQLKSPHLFYTNTYDLEGHLYNCGDLRRALADACGLTMQQAAELLGDQTHWVSSIAQNWKAWTVLCMISQAKQVNCGCTYDRLSVINPVPLAAPEKVLLDRHKTALAVTLNLPKAKFEQLYSRYERLFELSWRAQEPLRYFKGKWLRHLLQKHLEASRRIPDASINSIGEKVVSTLIAQVANNAQCKCCQPFLVKVQQLTHGLAQ